MSKNKKFDLVFENIFRNVHLFMVFLSAAVVSRQRKFKIAEIDEWIRSGAAAEKDELNNPNQG